MPATAGVLVEMTPAILQLVLELLVTMDAITGSDGNGDMLGVASAAVRGDAPCLCGCCCCSGIDMVEQTDELRDGGWIAGVPRRNGGS